MSTCSKLKSSESLMRFSVKRRVSLAGSGKVVSLGTCLALCPGRRCVLIHARRISHKTRRKLWSWRLNQVFTRSRWHFLASLSQRSTLELMARPYSQRSIAYSMLCTTRHRVRFLAVFRTRRSQVSQPLSMWPCQPTPESQSASPQVKATWWQT
jgi:hypothetical protein